MVTGEGAFAASLDADSEGVEGKFYVWSSDEIHEVLGADATLFCATYDITQHGNWEEANIPNLLVTGDIPPDLDARLAPMREKLLARRATRVRPGLDDKVLADWNGLMIAALVRAATLLDRPEWIAMAQTGLSFHCRIDEPGRAPRSFMARGRADISGFRPRSCRHDARRPRAVRDDRRGPLPRGLPRLARYAQTGFHRRRNRHARHDLGRIGPAGRPPRPIHDDAVPNANGVFAEALVRLAQISGADEDRQDAEQTLATLTGIARTCPFGHTSILNALDLHLRGLTIVIAGDGADALREIAMRVPYTDRTVVTVRADEGLDAAHPAHGAALGYRPECTRLRGHALLAAGK